MSDAIRVVVVDDDAWMRDALREVLSEQADLEWVGEAIDGASGVALCTSTRPDVAITDVRMPGGGPQAVTAMQQASPRTAIVICTADSSPRLRDELAAVGATGHFTKGTPLRELLSLVRTASSTN